MAKEFNFLLKPSKGKVSRIGKYVDTNQLVYNSPNHVDIPRGEPYDLYVLQTGRKKYKLMTNETFIKAYIQAYNIGLRVLTVITVTPN